MEKVVKLEQVIEKKSLIFGCAVIGVVWFFICFFSWINEPIGDDVLCYYDGALTYYLDEFEDNSGEKIGNFPQIFRLLEFVYTHWSGRMPGYFINYVGKLLPKAIQAFFTASVFVSNILLAVRIVYKKWFDTLSKPFIFGMLFLVVYWYRWDVYYTYMWTMVTIYSFGIMFCLLYYNLAVTDYENDKRHSPWLLMILGVIAGFSHEVISFCVIAIIGTRWLINVLRKREKWNEVFRHLGFGIGYLFCFFAPGNFYRQAQSHDTITLAYADRLKNSWDSHKGVLNSNATGNLIFILFAILAFIALGVLIERRNRKAVFEVLCDIVPFVVGGGTSILVWGMAPRTAPYGLGLWILIVYTIFLKPISEINFFKDLKSRNTISTVCTVAIMLLFIGANAKEVWYYSRVSIERRALVKEAVETKMSEVEVPLFDGDLSPDRYLLSYLNNQKQYDTEYYIRYYGTRLVVSAVE